MGTWSLAAFVILTLMSLGCSTVPNSDAKTPASATGEWLGVATVGPKFNCCFGAPGPVRLVLEQKGEALSGTLVGVGFRGTVSAILTEKGMWGSCMCTTRMQATNVYIEASIVGNDMVFRVSDSTMSLSRTP